MDQVKVALRYLKRIHFWVICPLVTLLGIAAWYVAIGALDEEEQSQVSDIEGAYSSVTTVTSKSPHPNSNVAEGMTALIDKTRNEVKEAWENKVAQQVDVLKWPDFPWSEGDKNRFLRTVEPLRPIERYVTIDLEKNTIVVDSQGQLNRALRENYRDYIQTELPRLAEQAGAVWVIRGGRQLPMAEERNSAIVDWNPASQVDLDKKHFNAKWKSSADSAGVPTTLQVLYAQEDLWVLGHLLDIIARANKGATTRHSAAVRKIIDIKIGKDAVESNVEIVSIGGDDKKEKKRRDKGADASSIQNPAEGRYVDENYEPLSAEVLQQFMGKAGEDSSIDLEQAHLAVAKRIPLRMKVSMDQRYINRLLVECANSELTVEVRQLTINTQDDTSRGPGRGGYASASLGGIEGGRLSAGRGPKADGGGSQFPFDLEVEVYGIVSIYNPVDNAALGIEPDEEATESEEEARATAGTIRR